MARKPIGRPEELTVDYRNLLSLTFIDRVNMARSAEGQAYLSALSPSQLEELFPNYYKKYLPKSLAGAASGGIPFQGELPVPSWRLPGTEFQQRPEREKQRVAPSAVPAPSKSPEIKESWKDKLNRLYKEQTETQSTQRYTSSTQINATAYSPRAGGSAMEGDYRASRPGPGQGKQGYVNTLSDYASGKASYVTVAGNPNMYNKRFVIPEISFYDKNGNLKTLRNVPVVVHDTGRAFKNAPSNRFDIPIDKDASDEMMSKSHSLWSKQGITFNEPETPSGRQSDATRVIEGDKSKTGSTAQTGLIRKKVGEIVDRTEEMKAAGYGSKTKPEPYKFIGVHYTGGGSLSSAINYAKNSNVGYQYIIDKDGTIHMIQNPDEGRSNHWGKNNIHPEAKNSNSLGIAFVGTNDTATPEQIKAGLYLLGKQNQKYGIDPRNVLGHGEVTQNHRADDEGKALLIPYRQQHELTPQTGNMPNIASQGGIRAWQNGNYNYDLNNFQERETTEVRPQQITPGEIPPLPEGLNPDILKGMSQDDMNQFAVKLDSLIKGGKYSVEQLNKDYASGKEQKQTAEPVSVDKNVSQKQVEFGAKRNLPITTQLENQLEYAAEKSGVKVEVFSGGQEKPFRLPSGKMTSTRHNQGNAADVKLYRINEKGEKIYLDARNKEDLPVIRNFIRQSVKAGAEGVGFGLGYMGPSSIHVGGGNRASWGGAEWIQSDLEAGVKQREEFNKSGGMKAWLDEKQKRIQEKAQQQQSNVSYQDVYNPEIRSDMKSRAMTSIGRDSPTAILTPPNQTGSTTPTGLTKESPSPGPAIPKQKVEESPPSQQSDTPTTEPVPEYEAQSEETVPGRFGGGEIPMKANENGIVMKNTGEVVAQINVDQEKLKTNPENGKLEVMPLRRNDPAEIQQKREQNIQNESNYAKQTSQSMENPNEVNRPTMTQEPQQNPNLRAMAEYNAAGGIPYSPSHERAMLNATTFGNSINHYGHKSTTTNLV